MSELLPQLQAVVADRYTIERELGRGGMATVYLAQDLKHHRPVALKVLNPQIAAVLGSERFLREIETAANLNHPPILPLFDSGAAGQPGSGEALLWYAMPYVEGESLRDLLNRERQLSMDRALDIARDVAAALAHAHARGIVHRDIKPENILLTGDYAVVADFGVAKAIGAAAGGRLTETGFAIGTAAYMSPEQASAERDLDGRSDIYALGCVLYEMLAGQPPFTGATAQSMMARHAVDPVPSLRTGRQEIPPRVEHAVKRALAKVPSDRFSTATQFAEALTHSDSGAVTVVAAPPARKQLTRMVAAAAALTLVVIVALVWSRRSSAPPLDPQLMAVFPFRISGTDTSHALLREGIVDILEAKFSGSGGARVLPPRTALAAWRSATGSNREDLPDAEAGELARRLGAGNLVLGTIVATPGHLLISGSLLNSEDGKLRAEAKVEGAPDSLLSLIDQFAAQLVALGAGVRSDRLASLTSTSLPALYEYLNGKAAHRAGQWDSATRHFERALELDSTFARAALGFQSAAMWVGADNPRIQRLAWTYRDRLSARDRIFLNALAGPRYPANSSMPERLEAWEEAARQVPDDPDIWYNLGDRYYHEGVVLGVPDPFQKAAEAFNQALALDTTINVEPMIHLLQIAAMERDTTTLRRLISRLPDSAPGSDYLRVQAAAVLKDSVLLSTARRTLDSTGNMGLLMDALMFGVAMDEAERSAAIYVKSAKPGLDQINGVLSVFNFYQQLGRPAAAAAAMARLIPEDAPPGATAYALVHYFHGYGDSSSALPIVARLSPEVEKSMAQDRPLRLGQAREICVLELWRVMRGDIRNTARVIARFRRDDPLGCGVFLNALLAAIQKRPDAEAAFNSVDSTYLAGGAPSGWIAEVARWREAQGDLPGALRAIQRCVADMGGNFVLAYCLREEGRIAALAGDREDAIKAYTHYLALRYHPEPSVQPEVDQVRAELARLMEEPRR